MISNVPRILGFMHILYGVEYLRESLGSIKDHVEKMHVCYSRNPSHGHTTVETCPDSREDILAICQEVLGDKLIWTEHESFGHENIHRWERHKFAQDYDIILSIDADEVFENIPEAINYGIERTERYFHINGYINFWKSFSFVCLDDFRPKRIEFLKRPNHFENHFCPLRVYHFSYAQNRNLIRYKHTIYGHAKEIRPLWLENVYDKWTLEIQFPDLHPIAKDLWTAVPFDKTTLPESLKKHKNYDRHLIT